MKSIILAIVTLLSASSYAQTNQTDDHWYGYPQERQVSAVVGGLTGCIFYSVARSNMEHEPKWKSMLISTGATLFTSSALLLMKDQTSVERRQNFTASFLSGVSITLIFSLGI